MKDGAGCFSGDGFIARVMTGSPAQTEKAAKFRNEAATQKINLGADR